MLKIKNEDVQVYEELRDVQLDQLSMPQFFDHPRVQEHLEVLMKTNEALEDDSIQPNKMLSHPIVSNQFHDLDAIISNPSEKPSPNFSDHAWVIGKSSTSNVGQVFGLKNVRVVENMTKGNFLDSIIGLDTGFRTPNDPVPLNSYTGKIKESIIFFSNTNTIL
ncbi:unnamed protein product [Lactuca virosa]|uniref:Uncharacterized protein n=1 Tax=Lactuca virosa TaxID=75947 RepID=A0AAU9NSK5_9ASTR|nr:unnamed protein product [Lactuca virosa]